MIENITTATPVEIDTRLAELHERIGRQNYTISSLTERVLDRSGLRVRHSATWESRRVTHTVSGTFEDGVAILTNLANAYDVWCAAGYPSDARPIQPAPGFSSAMSVADLDEIVTKRTAARAIRFALWTEAGQLESEYRARGGWTRYYLVVSSAGHIHSSTNCSTCRPTTTFGWMPERSGMTEAEAIESFGKHADALCSVCYPTAPVVSKRTNVTKAAATKLAAATVARQSDDS